MSVILHSKDTWGVCRCGHYDWQHGDSVINKDGLPVARADGHGMCGHNEDINDPLAEKCPCRQFTWVEWVPHRGNIHGPTPKLEAS